MLKSPDAPCMGEDVHGNKYFEDSAQPAGPLLSSVCTLLLTILCVFAHGPQHIKANAVQRL